MLWMFIIGGIVITVATMVVVWVYTIEPVDIDLTLDTIRRIT